MSISAKKSVDYVPLKRYCPPAISAPLYKNSPLRIMILMCLFLFFAVDRFCCCDIWKNVTNKTKLYCLAIPNLSHFYSNRLLL